MRLFFFLVLLSLDFFKSNFQLQMHIFNSVKRSSINELLYIFVAKIFYNLLIPTFLFFYNKSSITYIFLIYKVAGFISLQLKISETNEANKLPIIVNLHIGTGIVLSYFQSNPTISNTGPLNARDTSANVNRNGVIVISHIVL